MGFLGFGGSSHDSVQQERAEQRGQRAWEELQETTEEVQEAVQEKLGHAKHKADQQAQSVKGQMGHLRGRAPEAAEQGEQHGRVQAEEVSEKVVNAKERVKGKAESSANAVAERASSTADQIKGKAWDVKESAKEKAQRAEETAEDQAQDTKQGLKSKWWEKKEKAGKAADETSWKTRSNIRSAEQTAAEKAEEAKRAVAEKAEQAKEAAQHGAQRVRSNMQTVAEISKEKAGEAKEKVGGKGQQLKSGARDKVGELEEDAESVKEAAKRKAEDAKRSAAKPVWWLGRKADQGADKAAEGAGKAEGVVQGSAQEVREAAVKAGRWVGDKADRATDRAAQGVGYTAGYAEGTAEEVVHGAQQAFRKARDTVGDDLKVPVKRVETPFLSIRSKTVKELLAGGIAGAIAQTSATPLEVVRTKLLGGRHGQNVGQVVKHLNRKSGKDWPVKQTSGSFGTNVLRVAIQKSVELATYESVKAKLKRRGHPGDRQIPGLDQLPRQVPESTWAGAAAGVASTLATYPFEALKDRVLIMPEKYSGFGDAFQQVLFHEGGLPALYRGVVPAVVGIVPQSAVNYYTYDRLKEDYRRRTGRKHVPAVYTLAFGATAGAVSQLATYPLEVARKQVSVSVLPAVETGKAANAAYANLVEAVRGILQEEGVAGLYKGAGAQVAQVIPVAGLSWVVFEAAKRALQAEEEDED